MTHIVCTLTSTHMQMWEPISTTFLGFEYLQNSNQLVCIWYLNIFKIKINWYHYTAISVLQELIFIRPGEKFEK